MSVVGTFGELGEYIIRDGEIIYNAVRGMSLPFRLSLLV